MVLCSTISNFSYSNFSRNTFHRPSLHRFHWYSIDFAGDTSAQSVTQLDGHVTVSEKAHLELRCNYSYGATPNLFWYVQYPSQGLQLLLKYLSGPSDALVQGIKGFEAEFKKSELRRFSFLKIKKSFLPPEETLSPLERLGQVLLCCEWHSAWDYRGSWTQTFWDTVT